MRFLIPLLLMVSCGSSPSTSKSTTVADSVSQIAPAKFSTAKIVATYPHDAEAYTQGLIIDRGQMYESTGQYGLSSLCKVDLTTGKVERKVDIGKHYFGEGLAVIDDELYLLTWREGRAFVYDIATFKRKATNAIRGEGWGLASNDGELYMSDGTSTICVLDPKNFTEKRRFTVRYERGELDMLNELEWIEGKLWANIYTSDLIAIINPQDGRVEEFIDCSSLQGHLKNPQAEVLNGIAYDSVSKKVYLTGKNWDKLFEITR